MGALEEAERMYVKAGRPHEAVDMHLQVSPGVAGDAPYC